MYSEQMTWMMGFLLLLLTTIIIFQATNRSYLYEQSQNALDITQHGVQIPPSFAYAPLPGELNIPSVNGIILQAGQNIIRVAGSATTTFNSGSSVNQIQIYNAGSLTAAFDTDALYVKGLNVAGTTTCNGITVNGNTTCNGSVGIGAANAAQNLTIYGNVTITGTINTNGAIQSYGNQLLPIGSIIMYYSSAIPSGWTLCNGVAVSRTDGGGNITPPDLRNRFVYGGDTSNVNGTGGADSTWITLTTNHLPSHTHTGNTNNSSANISDPGHSHNILSGTYDFVMNNVNYVAVTNSTAYVSYANKSGYIQTSGTGIVDTGHSHYFTTNSTGSGNAFNVATIPPYLRLCYIMKY
jgi:microcystin-dependent protein